MTDPEQSYVEFKPPQGWAPPETDGSSSGEFDLVCSFKALPDGKVCLVKFGETPMPVKGTEKKEKAPDYKAYSKDIVSATGPDDSGSGMGY